MRRFRGWIAVATALVATFACAGAALGHPGRPSPSGAADPPPSRTSPFAPRQAAAGCPTTMDAQRFAGAERLLELNKKMEDLGRRPTASPAHRRFITSIDRKLRRIPGVQVRSMRYEIDRWLERRTELAAGAPGAAAPLRHAGAVPYSKRTGAAGVSAPLVYLPPEEEIDPDRVAGKIVVRDAVPGVVPNAVFNALAWSFYDPDLTFVPYQTGNYERDYLGVQTRVDDLNAAAEAGAAGLVMVHDFPRKQVKRQYAPYTGEHWQVPAVYVGVDEGEQLKQLAEQGGEARIRIKAGVKDAGTRTVIGTLPGMSPERFVVESHTDGMNAVWDNGPVAMLPLLRAFAGMPLECRPRTIEFAFTTAHLHLDEGGAYKYAAELDHAYDEGTLALVMAMEHLGAQEYAAVPREDGGPGRQLAATGMSEPSGFFTGQSPLLVEEVTRLIVQRDVRRSLVLRGADLPQATIPPHHSFGGEGTSYHNKLLPTVALVAGPWSLYNPYFGIEAVDPELMRRQTLVFGDLMLALASTPREAIAGGYLGEREVRELLCGSDPSGFGLVQCSGP